MLHRFEVFTFLMLKQRMCHKYNNAIPEYSNAGLPARTRILKTYIPFFLPFLSILCPAIYDIDIECIITMLGLENEETL